MIEISKKGGDRWEWVRRGRSIWALLSLGVTNQETYQQSLEMFTEMSVPGYIKVLEERLKDFGGGEKTA